MNIASVIKAEISRVARKQLRAERASVQRAYTQHRSEISSLNARVLELEKQVNTLIKHDSRRTTDRQPEKESPSFTKRFSAKGMVAQRLRLGLSAAEMGLLLNVSAQSVYYWEQGKSRPRASHVDAIRAVRKMGKRDAAYRLSVVG